MPCIAWISLSNNKKKDKMSRQFIEVSFINIILMVWRKASAKETSLRYERLFHFHFFISVYPCFSIACLAALRILGKVPKKMGPSNWF